MERKDLGQRLKARRIALGWSLREAAKTIGVDHSTLGHVETRGMNLTLDTLEKILVGYGLTMGLEEEAPQAAVTDPRAAVRARFAAILPFIPDEELDVFILQLGIWERRHRS